MRVIRLALAVVLFAGATAAEAQGSYGAPPPRRGGGGFNCEAVQIGVTGAAPFACPLPGARPLGARCFCEQPPGFFSGRQPPLEGRVVP